MEKGFAVFIAALIVMTICFICAPIAGFYAHTTVTYPIDKDTTTYLKMVDSTSNASLCADYIQNCIDGYEKHGITKGSWKLYYEKPENSMEYYIERLESIKTRYQAIDNASMNTYDYEKGMYLPAYSGEKNEIDKELQILINDKPFLTFWLAKHKGDYRMIIAMVLSIIGVICLILVIMALMVV